MQHVRLFLSSYWKAIQLLEIQVMNQAIARPLLLTALLSIIITVVTCCDRQSQEQTKQGSPKSTAATVTPVTPSTTATPSPTETYPATLAEGIDFAKPGYPTFIAGVTGMSGYESWGRWTDGDRATFRFTQLLPKHFTLVIQGNAFGPNFGEAIKIKIGATQQEFKITEQGQIHRLDFTLPEPADTLELLISKPTSPLELKIGDDPRKLGIGLIKLQIESDTPAAATTLPTYAAHIATPTTQVELEQGNFVTLTFTVTNHGSLTWTSDPLNPIHFAYHLLDGDGKMLKPDNPRTAFPQPVPPSQQVTLTLKLDGTIFPSPGQYRLDFDLVQEGKTWFAQQGSPTLTLPVRVTELQAQTVTLASLRDPQQSLLEAAYPEFGQLWKLIHFTLNYTHEDFTLDSHHYQGFVAGGGYPQLWTRDSATVEHGARWFFAKPALSDWIELHLSHQGSDGNIRDWVNAKGQSDKNTVETRPGEQLGHRRRNLCQSQRQPYLAGDRDQRSQNP
jgi:Domain of unknown function (DUF7024)